jgi:hypothetical protein
MKPNEIKPVTVSEVAMRMVMNVLWQRLPKKSFISGLWLRSFENTPLWPNCFLHILPIDKYPMFKYYYGNIILATPGERGLWMQGSEEDRIQYALDIEEKSRGNATANWKAVHELEGDLIILYKREFPTTRGMFINYHYSLNEQQQIIGTLNRKFWSDFQK